MSAQPKFTPGALYRTVIRDDDTILTVYESADRRKVRNAARRAVRQLARTSLRTYSRAADISTIGFSTTHTNVRWWLETVNARGTHRTDPRGAALAKVQP